MEDAPRLLLALSPPAERCVERLLFDQQSPLSIIASALDGADLDRLAAEHQPDVVLLSPDLPALSAARCARLRASGIRLVGLAIDASSASALNAFGVDAVVDSDIDLEQLCAELAGAERRSTAPVDPPERTQPPRGHRDDRGSILAVVGSRGAPGSSECAASLAVLAQERWPTVLAECDLLGGGLDLRLAADGHDGSLLGLVRACTAGDGALGELLERWLVRRPCWPPVLLAPPEPWEPIDELSQPGVLATAVQALAHAVPLAICDVGFLLEEGGEPTALSRCHREVLTCADAVLLVVGARDRQVRDGFAQLDLLRVELEIPSERLRVACNGLNGPGTGPSRQLAQMLAERLAERGLALDAILPFDRRALRRAEKQGAPLAVARRRGGYARAVARLLDQLFLPAAVAAPRERKLRLPLPEWSTSVAKEVAAPWRTR